MDSKGVLEKMNMFKFFRKKVKCPECDVGLDKIDGGTCLTCNGTCIVTFSIFSYWSENRLREKYGYPRLVRIS